MALRVMHIIDSFITGGAEILLVNSLAKNSFPPDVYNIVVVFNKGNEAISGRIDSNITFINLQYSGMLRLPATLLKLRRIIKQHKINLVHSHLTGAGIYARIAAPASVKQIHTIHTSYTADNETPPKLKWLERNILFKSSNVALIFLSAYLQQDFLKHIFFKGKTYVLANFADDIFFKNSVSQKHNSKFTIVTIGKFSAAKNYHYLLEVFRHLKNTGIELHIYSTWRNQQYEDVVANENLPIVLKGSANNIAELIGGYDLFILPSIYEGYPVSVIEAMAKGVPCFLSDIEPLRHVFKDAALFFKLDDPKAVADALIELSKRPDILDILKQKGENFANAYGKREVYIRNLVEIYHDFTGN